MGAAWFAVGMILDNDAMAVPYDPFLELERDGGPWISERLPTVVRRKIESAYELVRQRLEDRPQCSRLFSELDEDGAEIMRRTLYFPADAIMEKKLCWRAYAFTKVGIQPTWICRRMWLLPVSRFALVLLHEALHHAGLEEWPHANAADDSESISGRVTTACGF